MQRARQHYVISAQKVHEKLSALPSVMQRRVKMSEDLIKREDAIKIMACEMYAEAQSQGYDVDSIEDFMPEAKAWMNDAPSADRPQGEWIEQEDDYHHYWECSECGMGVGLDDIRNFCPNCGARMKGADDE